MSVYLSVCMYYKKSQRNLYLVPDWHQAGRSEVRAKRATRMRGGLPARNSSLRILWRLIYISFTLASDLSSSQCFWSERRCAGGLAAGGRSGHYKRRYFLCFFCEPHFSPRRVCARILKYWFWAWPVSPRRVCAMVLKLCDAVVGATLSLSLSLFCIGS